jgi:hypothetical protein
MPGSRGHQGLLPPAGGARAAGPKGPGQPLALVDGRRGRAGWRRAGWRRAGWRRAGRRWAGRRRGRPLRMRRPTPAALALEVEAVVGLAVRVLEADLQGALVGSQAGAREAAGVLRYRGRLSAPRRWGTAGKVGRHSLRRSRRGPSPRWCTGTSADLRYNVRSEGVGGAGPRAEQEPAVLRRRRRWATSRPTPAFW